MIEADCPCGCAVHVERNGKASYFYCPRPACNFYHKVFRCYGSMVDDDFREKLIDGLRKHDDMLDRIVIHGKGP